MDLEGLRKKYPFVPEGDVLLELSSVFGEVKASQMYEEAIQSDGIKMFRKGSVSHEISVSHCGNCVSYKRVVNPWYLSMIKDVDSL